MPRYERIKGLRVITIKEGNGVGKVDDLVVDSDQKKVSWLRLHSGGFVGDRHWVPVEAVHSLGDDVVTINAEADLRASPNAPEAEALVKTKRGLIGKKMVTESGERLGEIGDYEFTPDTFALTNLFVSPAMNFLGQFLTVPADKVLTIGQDAVIVTADAVKRADAGQTLESRPPLDDSQPRIASDQEVKQEPAGSLG
jgi:sporulation protein YlmC with PRC-barrel domain